MFNAFACAQDPLRFSVDLRAFLNPDDEQLELASLGDDSRPRDGEVCAEPESSLRFVPGEWRGNEVSIKCDGVSHETLSAGV